MSDPEQHQLTMTEAVEARVVGSGPVIKLSILAIDNADLVPFGVIVARIDGTEIGRIAVFPADQTGDYFLPLAVPLPDSQLRLAIDAFGGASDITLTFTVTRE